MSTMDGKSALERLEEFVTDWEESKPDRDTVISISGHTLDKGSFEYELRVSDIRKLLDEVKSYELDLPLY